MLHREVSWFIQVTHLTLFSGVKYRRLDVLDIYVGEMEQTRNEYRILVRNILGNSISNTEEEEKMGGEH
jgi:hypothetical protein